MFSRTNSQRSKRAGFEEFEDVELNQIQEEGPVEQQEPLLTSPSSSDPSNAPYDPFNVPFNGQFRPRLPVFPSLSSLPWNNSGTASSSHNNPFNTEEEEESRPLSLDFDPPFTYEAPALDNWSAGVSPYNDKMELEEYLAMSRADGSTTWYFQEREYKYYKGTEDLMGPIRIKDDFVGTIHTSDMEPGLYYVTISLDFDGLFADELEALSINLSTSTKESKTTILNGEYAQIPSVGVVRLRMHQQICISKGSSLRIAMYLQCLDQRSITLHSVDLQRRHALLNPTDILITGSARPICSVDVWHKDDPEDMNQPLRPVFVEQFAMSITGVHCATLAYTAAHAHLDLWNTGAHVANGFQYTGHVLTTPCASISVPWAGEKTLQLALSGDSSQIALFSFHDPVQEGLPFRLFRHKDEGTFVPAQPTVALQQDTEVQKRWPVLDGFEGYAKFHLMPSDQKLEASADSERFIACDGYSVLVFCVTGKWTLLHSIQLSVQRNLQHAWILINSVRAGRFVWMGNEEVMSVWKIDSGQPTTFVSVPLKWHVCAVCFSSDGSKVALSYIDGIRTYRSDSGIELGGFVPTNAWARRLAFIRGDTQLMVDTCPHMDASVRQGYYGVALDARNMAGMAGKYFPDSQGVLIHHTWLEDIVLQNHGSILDLIGLDDITVKSPISIGGLCSIECSNNIPPLDTKLMDCTLDFGLELRIEMRQTIRKDGTEDKDFKSAVVVLESWRTGIRELLTVTPFELDGVRKKDLHFARCFFLKQRSQVVVMTNLCLQVWSVPIAGNENCELLLMWKLQQSTNRIFHGSALESLWTEGPEDDEHWMINMDFVGDESFTGVADACSHQDRLGFHVRRVNRNRVAIMGLAFSVSSAFDRSNFRLFLEGVTCLPLMYEEADEQARQAIIRYAALHINTYLSDDHLAVSVMSVLCIAWAPKNHAATKLFVKDLLFSGRPRWIPRTDYKKWENPISILLEKAKTQPLAITLAKIIIGYCVNQAQQERNLSYISPVFGCMDDLVIQFPSVALDVSRGIAFFPAAHRSVIINNHCIAHPPAIRRFWKKNNRPLYKCVEPVLQYQFSHEPINPLNDNFTREIYVVPFDLLWNETEIRNYTEGLDSKMGYEMDGVTLKPPTSSPSWFGLIFWHFFGWPWRRNFIRSHDCRLDFYDNPAIEALVEYKWNKFGFALWLARFTFQCIYYMLILLVAFMQIYHEQRKDLYYVFVGIIVLSSFFLWLELQQFLQSARRYISSPYNILDLIVFIVPMVASAQQIKGIRAEQENGSARVISFSVLLIFLHLFFELRINKSVCKFVTVILHVIAEIKIFFIIFAVGILYFSLAILHMTRGCSLDGCTLPDSEFPTDFFHAISATYFVIGGRYDPVDKMLTSTDDWPFHAMMMIYFFFTVVLMINFLIVLVNVAFNKGDDTWRQVWVENRLRYVETVENMSYRIPGFRKAHDWFPKEIYYSALPSQVEAFHEKVQRKKNETSTGADVEGEKSTAVQMSEMLKRMQYLQGFIEQIRTPLQGTPFHLNPPPPPLYQQPPTPVYQDGPFTSQPGPPPMTQGSYNSNPFPSQNQQQPQLYNPQSSAPPTYSNPYQSEYLPPVPIQSASQPFQPFRAPQRDDAEDDEDEAFQVPFTAYATAGPEGTLPTPTRPVVIGDEVPAAGIQDSDSPSTVVVSPGNAIQVSVPYALQPQSSTPTTGSVSQSATASYARPYQSLPASAIYPSYTASPQPPTPMAPILAPRLPQSPFLMQSPYSTQSPYQRLGSLASPAPARPGTISTSSPAVATPTSGTLVMTPVRPPPLPPVLPMPGSSQPSGGQGSGGAEVGKEGEVVMEEMANRHDIPVNLASRNVLRKVDPGEGGSGRVGARRETVATGGSGDGLGGGSMRRRVVFAGPSRGSSMPALFGNVDPAHPVPRPFEARFQQAPHPNEIPGPIQAAAGAGSGSGSGLARRSSVTVAQTSGSPTLATSTPEWRKLPAVVYNPLTRYGQVGPNTHAQQDTFSGEGPSSVSSTPTADSLATVAPAAAAPEVSTASSSTIVPPPLPAMDRSLFPSFDRPETTARSPLRQSLTADQLSTLLRSTEAEVVTDGDIGYGVATRVPAVGMNASPITLDELMLAIEKMESEAQASSPPNAPRTLPSRPPVPLPRLFRDESEPAAMPSGSSTMDGLMATTASSQEVVNALQEQVLQLRSEQSLSREQLRELLEQQRAMMALVQSLMPVKEE